MVDYFWNVSFLSIKNTIKQNILCRISSFLSLLVEVSAVVRVANSSFGFTLATAQNGNQCSRMASSVSRLYHVFAVRLS